MAEPAQQAMPMRLPHCPARLAKGRIALQGMLRLCYRTCVVGTMLERLSLAIAAH